MKRISTLLLVLIALVTMPQVVSAHDVEAATIAEFNAAEDGKVVKLTLTDARVNAYYNIDRCYYVEDASGATVVKGINLTVGTKLNGYIVGKKSTTDVDYVNDPSQGLEYALTVVDASQSAFEATETPLVGTSMTIAEVAAQANYGKLVKLNNIAITPIGNGMNKLLTDAAGNTMKARDLFGVLPEGYVWPEQVSEITGIALYYMTGWFLIPISADAIVEASAQPIEVIFDFENNNMGLTAGTGGTVEQQNAGDLLGKTITLDGVVINVVNSPTMPTRYYKASATAKAALQAVAGGQIRFTAPKGYAIKKIRITPSTAATNKWGVDGEVGELSTDLKTWEGNAETVRFTANGSLFLLNVTVTLAEKDADTKPATELDNYAVEVTSLKDFRDLDDNTLTKLTLNNAIVTAEMFNKWGYYIQDATAGAHVYCTGLNLKVGDVLNGFIYAKRSNQLIGTRIAMTEATNANNLSVTTDEVTPIETTVQSASAYTEIIKSKKYYNEDMNKLIKLTGVSVVASDAKNALATDSNGNTIGISNPLTTTSTMTIESLAGINYSKANVVGILYHGQKDNGNTQFNAIYPISITEGSGTGIENVDNSRFTVNNAIYNLQGIRLNSLQRGLNIVNGKKLMIK